MSGYAPPRTVRPYYGTHLIDPHGDNTVTLGSSSSDSLFGDEWTPKLSGWGTKGSRPSDSTSAAAADSSAASGSPSSAWAVGAGIFSALTQAYAQFAAVRSQKYQLKSQASALEFQADMAQLDRRAALRRATSIVEQRNSEIANLTLEAGQQRAAGRTAAAAGGVAGGSASTREAEISGKLIQAIDAYHINLSALRAANQARADAVDAGNRSLLGRVGARNMRRNAGALHPEDALYMGALGAIGQLGSYGG